MGPDPRRLTALIETQSALAAAGPDAGAVVSIVASHARELTGADGCVIELIDGSNNVFRAAADSAVVQVGGPVDPDGLAGRAVAERRLMTLVDIAQEGQPTGGSTPFRSGVAAPLEA